MKIVFCGTHVVGVGVLNHLIQLGYKPSYIVTTKDDLDGKISGFYNFSDLAKKFDIPVYYAKTYTLKNAQDQEFFETNKFDLIVQGGWQRLFPDEVLRTLKIGAIGMHGSPDFLPRGRGRSPLNWSLIQDAKRFIMHMFLIKPGVDDGDVFDTYTFDINQLDDIDTLYIKYSLVYKKLLERNLQKLKEGRLELLPQTGKSTYYPQRKPEDGEIKFEDMNVWEIYNLVRAVTKPYPGAYAQNFAGQNKITIWKARVLDTRITYPNSAYGEVVDEFEGRLVVNCLGGLLLIETYDYE